MSSTQEARKMLLEVTRPYWPGLLWCALGVVGLTLSQVSIPFFVKWIIDNVIHRQEYAHVSYSIGLGLALVFLAVVQYNLDAWARCRLSVLGASVVRDLRLELWKKLYRLPQNDIEKWSVGQLSTRLIADLNTIHEFCVMGFSVVPSAVLTFFVISCLTVALDYRLACVILVLPVINVLIAWAYARLTRSYMFKEAEYRGEVNRHLHEHLSALETVRSLGLENRLGQLFQASLYQLRHAKVWGRFWRGIVSTIVEVSPRCSELFCVLAILWFIHQGWEGLSLGTAVAFLLYIPLLLGPIEAFFHYFDMTLQTWVALNRVNDFLMLSEDTGGGFSRSSLQGHIVCQDLSFGYSKDQMVLKDVSFDIPAGSFTAIVGATGSGQEWKGAAKQCWKD